MYLKEHYWYFQKILTDDFCDKVIKHALHKKTQLGLTFPYTNKNKLSKKELTNLKNVRNSKIVWLEDSWIYNELTPLIHKANENAGWNFDIDWFETAQFTIYGKKQHYDWHQDSLIEPYESTDINFNKKIRKLSITCTLSNEKTYVGGNFQLDIKDKDRKNVLVDLKEIKPRGSVVVFPSSEWHRVTPVTKGTRYSLVIWAIGKPFR